MDEDAKARLKLKFYGLTVELNIIVLLAAMSIAIFFIIHSPYTLPVIIVMLILALVLSLDFVKRYRETKAWIYAQPEKSKEVDDSKQKEKTE
ncbi:MAG: hypothetical protein Q7U51_05635 [Methanoregula sp.]|nr:hypothetical protein [Methanoregula sp.]